MMCAPHRLIKVRKQNPAARAVANRGWAYDGPATSFLNQLDDYIVVLNAKTGEEIA